MCPIKPGISRMFWIKEASPIILLIGKFFSGQIILDAFLDGTWSAERHFLHNTEIIMIGRILKDKIEA